MSFKFNISEILTRFELTERERNNLARLFDYTNFLYDDETNLTKTFNLIKGAREKLMERISEMFESDLFEDASEEEEEAFKGEKDQ
jgi:hypothetical protein